MTDEPPRSRMSWRDVVEAGLTLLIVLGFFAAYAVNWRRSDGEGIQLFNGALVSAFAGAVGYWLGTQAAKRDKTP